jgi:hypothetical protein
MSLLSPLRAVLNRRARFRLTDPKPLPAGTTLRLFKPSDRDDCLAIYRANEVGRFPKGFVPYFEDFLDRTDFLKIVLCEKDRPVAIGGIGLTPFFARRAWLAFGMVSPTFHGRGLGTALLLSRVALLPQPSSPIRLVMTNVGRSEEFFARFGFASSGKAHSGQSGVWLPRSATLLDVDTWRLCRECVKSLELELPEASIPKINVLRRTPRRRGNSKLDQAVLIELTGLISLFVIPRPYNWLGWALIVVGGVLYRQELKRRKAAREAQSPPKSVS